MMEPLKVEAPTMIEKKTHSATRSSHEPTVEAENLMKMEDVVDVEAIPSLVIEPVTPIVVDKKDPTYVLENM
jgi:hypothetical protein